MSYSEKGFGARIENAQQLLLHLSNMADYAAPTTDLATSHLKQLITATKKWNELAVDSMADYRILTDKRAKLYRQDPLSLEKLTTPINASVRAVFGKESQQVHTISALIRKVRGVKLKQSKQDANTGTMSQSERSYGSLTQLCADIIVILEKYGTQYNPGNANIQPAALKTLFDNMEQAGKEVTTALTAQKTIARSRQESYSELHKITQRIKDAIKSQYTGGSVQYSLVRKLVI